MSDAPPELVSAIADAVRACLRGDGEGMRTAVRAVADVDFPAGVAFACFAWARVAAAAIFGSAEALIDYPKDGTSAGVQFLSNGGIINAEDADPVTRFTGRMIACAINDDQEAAMVLFDALDGSLMADCAVAMVAFTAAALHDRAHKGTDLTGGAVPWPHGDIPGVRDDPT